MTKRINRKLLAGIVGAALLVLTLGSISTSAAVPYGCGAPGVNCGVPYGGYLSYQPGYVGYAGYAGNAGYGQVYFDPRYCGDGLIAIVPEPSNGAPINICATTGVRIYPVIGGYGPYGAFGGQGFAPAGFVPYAYNPYIYR